MALVRASPLALASLFLGWDKAGLGGAGEAVLEGGVEGTDCGVAGLDDVTAAALVAVRTRLAVSR